MKNKLTLIIIGYFALFLFFSNKVFKDEDFCSNESKDNLVPLTANFEKSANNDASCIITYGKVVQSGCFFWDLLFIKSYKIQTRDGYRIRVYTRISIPNEGELIEIKGVFRQFSRNAYHEWFGLIEHDREYLKKDYLAGGK